MAQAPRDTPDRVEVRDALIVCLALLSGSADAISFLTLGHVFTSVITGNLVLAGLGIAGRNLDGFLHAALAIGAFALGAAGGSRIAGVASPGDGRWPRPFSIALRIEFTLLAAFTVLWELSAGHPASTSRTVLLALLATAMGIQSAAFLRLGIVGLSTTYLTGTLTSAIHALVHRGAWRASSRSVAILVAAILGAAGGGAAALEAPWVAPLIPLCLLAVVVCTGARIGFRMPAVP
jgi:uncharacterized membrane protein YoaK (UPF0700 family)